ncbi:hypothetical protein [Streptomyces sp. NPDC096153]|uniref:hypothetical protein n=1 Tax=Streptomyces sp. NPDC096153 TaxID=3155548 RepID=UPI0033265ACC
MPRSLRQIQPEPGPSGGLRDEARVLERVGDGDTGREIALQDGGGPGAQTAVVQGASWHGVEEESRGDVQGPGRPRASPAAWLRAPTQLFTTSFSRLAAVAAPSSPTRTVRRPTA